ncbi:hypothetical protein LCGC14_0455820 [marine sediment metagenome]|uniref:Uncharacterized protein n=1 Tax=marine sediment metagenome TaxID=412755 RepID=A0A0F9V3D2_9ZZZZ
MPKKTLKQAERELAKALGRLDEYQGIVGRRNARKAVAKALRSVRNVVDRDFAPIRGRAKKRLSGKPADVQRRFHRRMEELDYDPVPSDAALMGMLVKAKVPMKVEPGTSGMEIWIPHWVLMIPHHARTVSRLRKLAKSPNDRRVWLARKALEKE